MIAYVSTISYQQEFSKLVFEKSIVEEVTEADFKKWQKNGNQNFIKTRHTGLGYHQAIFSEYYPPEDDIRYKVSRIVCHSKVRIPIPEKFKQKIQQWRPSYNPKFWVPKLEQEDIAEIRDFLRSEYYSKASNLENMMLQKAKKSKRGKLLFTKALRIPYRTNTGYPWISEKVKNRKYVKRSKAFSASNRPPADKVFTSPPNNYEYYMDTEQGADKGFAYCFRELNSRFRNLELAYSHDSKKRRQDYWNHPRKIFIDGKLEVFEQSQISSIWFEEDKYLLADSNFGIFVDGTDRQSTR